MPIKSVNNRKNQLLINTFAREGSRSWQGCYILQTNFSTNYALHIAQMVILNVLGDQETYLAPTEKILDSVYKWETWMHGTTSAPSKDMHLLFKV